MTTTGAKTKDGTVGASLSFLENMLGDFRPRDFAVRFWDGTTWDAEPGQPTRFTLVLKHPGALPSMFWPPNEISLAEAYIYDDFDVEGRIENVFPLADHLLTRRRNPAESLRQARRLLSLPGGGRREGRPGDKAARLRGAPLEGARPAGRHLPLRRSGRVLRAVVGRADGLLLRVLRHARGGSGYRPGAQARLHLPQAAAAAR